MRRICLVGAGAIARVHAEALRSLDTARIAAVVDPDQGAARRLAAASGAVAHASAAEALAAGGFDRAHVLTPPDRHAEAALPLLRAGIPVLLEKPLAADAAACETLQAAACLGGAALGVNQNFVYHPAFLRLRRKLSGGALGRPRAVSVIYNVPLRQLASRQFGHWMFHAPRNILLEQAVHPLSQIAALAGPVGQVRALAGPAVALAPGLPFCPSLDATLACRDLPAQLRFAVGQSFPFWQVTVVCDDGVAVADILADRCHAHGRTRWLEAVDGAVSGGRVAGAVLGDSLRNAARYGLSTMRLAGRSDAFFLSMRASIAAFHAALDRGAPPPLDGAFGADLVAACENLAAEAFPTAEPRRLPRPAEGAADIAVLGGTGFIGAHVVDRLLREGHRVAVLARNTRNLPAPFDDPRVTLHRGDARDAAAVGRAIAGAAAVVNLAHGGGGEGYAAVRAAMVGSAETVARACLAAGVRRLVHVGSIASLYLGPQRGAVTGATAPDPQASRRADYARAKAECDRLLLDLHAREGLPVCILRPGVVVGDGATPFHSGLGFYNNEQHCIGWNRGRNALPFVLVEDVADAVVRACASETALGRAYNLVGDVRLTARDYLAALARATGRPLRFHPQAATLLWLQEFGKWLVKRAGGRREARLPSHRDLLSRGMRAEFDCSDAKRDLGWRPVAEAARFLESAVGVHAA